MASSDFMESLEIFKDKQVTVILDSACGINSLLMLGLKAKGNLIEIASNSNKEDQLRYPLL